MTTMATAFSYEDVDSSAILSLKGNDEGVFVTFRGKNIKEYAYNCENLERFAKNVQIILKDPEKSIGAYINELVIKGAVWLEVFERVANIKILDRFVFLPEFPP